MLTLKSELRTIKIYLYVRVLKYAPNTGRDGQNVIDSYGRDITDEGSLQASLHPFFGDAFDSAWAGAQTAGVEFPNTDPSLFVGDIGETMAEVRARITCTNDGCSSLEPSMNLIYRDIWTADPVMTLPSG